MQPQDTVVRYVIGVGVLLMLPGTLEWIGVAFRFSGVPFILIVHNLMSLLVLFVAMICAVIPLSRFVPAFRPLDEPLAPLCAAILLAWLVVQVVLLSLTPMITVFWAIQAAIGVFGYFGILMLTAPAAYDEAKQFLMRQRGGWRGLHGRS